MGKERITFSPTHHTLFPTLTLTLTFHHPEQSLLHKLHWLDHVIRVGVFSVKKTRLLNTKHTNSYHMI